MTSPKHLMHVFPSFGAGGVPIRITAVMNHFGDKCRHTVIALDGNADAAERIEEDIDVTIFHPEINKKHPLRTIGAISGHIRNIAPDLLLTYNWGATEWALVNRLTGKRPHIHFESGFGPEEADRQIRRRVLFRRTALRRAERIVVPSENLVSIVRDIWRLDTRRLQLIPNGVDCDRYGSPPDASAVPGFDPAGATVVGTLAPLRAEKNIGALIEAFAAATAGTDTRLLIAGDGAERAGLEALAATSSAAARIHFAGYIERPEKVLGLMDIFAMSSDTEQMPNALLQAMAAGRPVVSTEVGDIRPILAEQNRPYVYPVGDMNAYAEGLSALIADGGLRNGLGAANLKRVREVYSMERMLSAYEELLLR
jgi:L-malate glycosyltransferase